MRGLGYRSVTVWAEKILQLLFFFIFSSSRSYYDEELINNTVFQNLLKANNKTFSQSLAVACVSRLNVYYESFYYTQVTESPQITPSTLMGTIGMRQNKIDDTFLRIELILFIFKKAANWACSLAYRFFPSLK